MAVKNHHNGALDPYAHFQNEITIEDVLRSAPVCHPLHLLDCCVETDNATCVIVTSAERARDLPPDVNPWSLPGIYISSLDLVKRPEVLRSLEEVTWDLCVVDEAHGAAPGTARLAAVLT